MTYLQGRQAQGEVGWLLDLREAEINILRDARNASIEEIVEQVRKHIANRFCSGAEFCDQNREYWSGMRTLLPMVTAENPEIASFGQFPLLGVNIKDKFPASSEGIEFRSSKEMEDLFTEVAPPFAEKIRRNGDKRVKDPEQAATNFLQEIRGDLDAIRDAPGDMLEKLPARDGVERARLPPNPTWEDVGDEAEFIGHLKVHERRLKLSPGTLKQVIRQEQVPSWIIYKEVDRTMKRLQKAEASSFGDKWVIPFALYLDAMEADKRVCECIRQALPSHPLMKIVSDRVFSRRSLADIADKLESMAEAATEV